MAKSTEPSTKQEPTASTYANAAFDPGMDLNALPGHIRTYFSSSYAPPGGKTNNEVLENVTGAWTSNLALFASILRHVSTALPDFTVRLQLTSESWHRLGEGGNFEVWSTAVEGEVGYGSQENLQAKTTVVVKKIRESKVNGEHASAARDDAALPGRILRSLIREVIVMRDMHEHVEILSLYGIGREEQSQGPGPLLSTNTLPYIVVEYASSGTLAEHLGISKFQNADGLEEHLKMAYGEHSFEERCSLLLEVARGIESLHRHGIIHTDIKPENILVTGDDIRGYHIRLADFGSALIFQRGDSGQTLMPLGRDIGGTAGYWPPDFAPNPENVLKRSRLDLLHIDIHAFGVCLVEALTSSRLFDLQWDGGPAASTSMSTTARHIESVVEPGSAVQTWLEIAVDCMDREGSRRDCVMETVVQMLSSDDTPRPKCCKTSPSTQGLVGLDVFEGMSDNHGFLALGDYNEVILDPKYMEGRLMILLLKTGIYPSPPMEWEWKAELFQAIQDMSSQNPVARPYLLFCSGICHALGFGTAHDPNKACIEILESARLGYRPAKFTYRRFHGAMFSFRTFDLEESYFPSPMLSALELRNVDRELFNKLEELERDDPNNFKFVASSFRLSERIRWSEKIIDPFLEAIQSSAAVPGSLDMKHAMALRLLRDAVQTALQTPGRIPYGENGVPSHGLYIAAAILLETDHPTILEQLLRKTPGLESPDCVLGFIPGAVSPLLLAARLGNTAAVKLLVGAGAKPSIRWEFDLIPLHFLFAFPEEDIPEMCLLLSNGLEPVCDYRSREALVSMEQMLWLQGNPLTFAMLANSGSAVRCLWEFRNFHPWHNVEIQNLESWLVILRRAAPEGWTFPPHMLDVASIMAPMGDMHSVLQSLQPWQSFLSAEGGFDDLAYTCVAAALLPMINLGPNMISLGPQYADAAYNQACSIFKMRDAKGGVSSHRDGGIALFEMFDYPGLIMTWRKAHEQSLPPKEAKEELSESFNSMMYKCGNSPRPNTFLDLFVYPQMECVMFGQTLCVVYLCSDLHAFKMLLHKAEGYPTQWKNNLALDLHGMYFLIATSTNRPHLSDYIDAVASFRQRYPGPWYRRLGVGLFGATRGAVTAGSLIGDCLHHGNAEALILFHRRDLFPKPPWPYGPSSINPLHLACVNDAYADTLAAFLRGLDPEEISNLLVELATPGDLTPLSVAVLCCSWRCASILLEYSGSLTFTTPDSKDEAPLLPAMVNMAAYKFDEYHTGHPWWPFSTWMIGARPMSHSEEERRQLAVSQLALLHHVHEASGMDKEQRAEIENLLRATGQLPDDPGSMTNKLPTEKAGLMAHNTLRAICGVVWIGQKIAAVRSAYKGRRFWVVTTATMVGVCGWILVRRLSRI